MKRLALAGLFFCLCFVAKAQFTNSKCIIRASWDSTVYEFITEKCVLLLDYNTGDLTLTVDLFDVHTDIDTLEKLLHRNEQTKLVFKGNLDLLPNQLIQQANKSISFKMTGRLMLNNNEHFERAYFSPVVKNTMPTAESGNNSNQGPLYLSMEFDFEPLDYHLDQYYPKLPKIIELEVVQGYVNRSQ